MKDSDYEEKFADARDALRSSGEPVDVSRFEHVVWTEIAIRNERGRLRWADWFSGRHFLVAAPAAAAIAIVAGIYLGFSQAAAYGKEASLAMEQRYVESIHPVMMSANHTEAGHFHP